AGELRAQARRLGRRNRRALFGVVGLHAAAATRGLAGRAMLGTSVQSFQEGTTTTHVDEIVGVLAIFLVAETILTWFARRASFVLSEKIFAELREDFMRRVLALPLSTVERAGTGDLVSRTTADVDSLARTVRFAVPETLIAGITTVLTVGAAIWVNPRGARRRDLGHPARRAAGPGRRTAALLQHPLVPEAGAGGVPLGARVVCDSRRHRQRDRRGRAHGRRPEPAREAREADRRRPRQRLSRRDAHALPADGLVPDGRVRVRAPSCDRARLGRLPRLAGPGHDRRGNRGFAVHGQARRSESGRAAGG